MGGGGQKRDESGVEGTTEARGAWSRLVVHSLPSDRFVPERTCKVNSKDCTNKTKDFKNHVIVKTWTKEKLLQ